MLARGIPKEERNRVFENVSFVVFNYDRCIEHFFLHALQKLYAIPEDDATDILGSLRIIHPYGVVGDVAFGFSRANHAELSKGIKTYTEQIDDRKLVDGLQNEIDHAASIVFLGFAYHDQNMALIEPAGPISSKRIFGTAYGMSDSDVELTTTQIAAWYVDDNIKRGAVPKSPVQIKNTLKRADLFDYYAKTLTSSN
jgi:hypothetical protein